MRADAVDLDIFGNYVRVICAAESEATQLRSDLSGHAVGGPVPVGFIMRPPQPNSKLHVLLDRSGFVLGRSRTSEASLSILKEHLGVFVPPPSTTLRLRMRALLGDDSEVVLVDASLLSTPPVAERRIRREGFQIIDRLAIDIDPSSGLELMPTPWAALSRADRVGHAETPRAPAPVSGVVVTSSSAEAPTKASRVARIAANFSSKSTISTRLDAAEWLASLPSAHVSFNDPAGIYPALRHLRGV